MAKGKEKESAGSPSCDRTSRLELIKRRHRELILKPRESLASDLEDGFDPCDDIFGTQEAELAEMAHGRF
jgi:hypothetical protein